MRENSRRGAPRQARAADRTAAGRDPRTRGAAGRGGVASSDTSTASSGPGRGSGGSAPGSADVTRVTSLIEPVTAALELDLESVKISSAGRRRVLRIIVDADGGVSLDDIAEVSREVAAALDARNTMGEAPYTLEVSSPGIDRPLTQPRHWRRAAGRLVAVPLIAEDYDPKRVEQASLDLLQGRVIAADSDGVTLDTDGVRRIFGYAELGPGRVQVEFGRLDEAADDMDTDDADADDADDADSASGADEEEPGGH
jgi:ribosome maturation factor RimP